MEASASKLQQLPWTTVFEDLQPSFCVPLAFLVRLLNAWLSSFMSGRVWRSPGKTTTKKKPRVPQHYVYSSHPCQSISHATRIKLYISAGQASAAALDNCFRKSSTSSAFRWRSWSDSLMQESVYVWTCSNIAGENKHQRKFKDV